MKKRAVVGWALSAVVALGACSKKSGPSPEYARAREEFNALYGRLLDDAYVSPEVGRIEAMLEQVPRQSEDHLPAQELLQRIRSNRERMQAALAERQAAVRGEMGAGPQDFQFAGAEDDAGGPEVKEPDAGMSGQPIAGMPVSELRGRFGMCFDPGVELEIPGRGSRATFALRNMAVCRERHPGFERKLVVAEGDRILLIADQKDVEIVGGDAGVPPTQNAGPLAGAARSGDAGR